MFRFWGKQKKKDQDGEFQPALNLRPDWNRCFEYSENMFIKYIHHSAAGSVMKVSGIYISDKYAVRESGKGYHVDHIPTGETVFLSSVFHEAMHEAKVRSGILPKINTDHLTQAERIHLDQDLKLRIKEAIDDGYYFAFEPLFLSRHSEAVRYLLYAGNREIFINRRIEYETGLLQEFAQENRLLVQNDPPSFFMKEHQLFQKPEEFILGSYLYLQLEKKLKIIYCSSNAPMILLAKDLKLPVFSLN